MLTLAFRLPAAESLTLTLTDGASLTGEIIKSDDNGVMLHGDGDLYTNVEWSRFSQDSLKQLAGNPKLADFVEPFIAPPESARPSATAIQINAVNRLERPVAPSFWGGLFGSSVGRVILFLLYLANLYAAFEVALVRNRPLFQVLGLAAVVPVIVPAVFAYLPMVVEVPPEEIPLEGAVPEKVYGQQPQAEVVVESATAAAAPKPAQAQVFARGKFTFNKRFMETKFAGFVGEPKGDGLKFAMSLKTTKEQFSVERIAQLAVAEAIFETRERGQVTVNYSDIQEIQLNPITA